MAMDKNIEIKTILKTKTKWQETAIRIANDIKFNDKQDQSLYFIRLFEGKPVTDDLSWVPDYDPYNEIDYEKYPKNNDEHKCHYYEDDRVINFLIEAKILDKEKTFSQCVFISNPPPDKDPWDEDSPPAGYTSFPKWLEVDNWEANIEKDNQSFSSVLNKWSAIVDEVRTNFLFRI